MVGEIEEVTLIDYARPLAERRAMRRTVGPYRWRPRDVETTDGIGFYLAGPDDLGCRPAAHGAAIRLRLAYVCGPYGPVRWTGDDDPVYAITARLPRGRGWLAGSTLGEGMIAWLLRDVHATREDAERAARDDAQRTAERMAEEAATQDECPHCGAALVWGAGPACVEGCDLDADPSVEVSA